MEPAGKQVSKVLSGWPVLELENQRVIGVFVLKPVPFSFKPIPEDLHFVTDNDRVFVAVDQVILLVAKVLGEGARPPQVAVQEVVAIGDQDRLSEARKETHCELHSSSFIVCVQKQASNATITRPTCDLAHCCWNSFRLFLFLGSINLSRRPWSNHE